MKIKNCPFCMRDEGELLEKPDGFFVFCNYDHAQGPWSDTAEEAIESWNKRPIESYLLKSIGEMNETNRA